MNQTKVVLFGASGSIGQLIMKEALDRGYEVTAVVPDQTQMPELFENLHVVEAQSLDCDRIAALSEGHQAIISACIPERGSEDDFLILTQALVEVTDRCKISRLLVVGDAGTLITSSGYKWMDMPDYPSESKSLAIANEQAYDILRKSDVDWTYCSPPSVLTSGRRTGQFRIGMDMLILDEGDRSIISAADYAVAFIDELEDPYFVRARFTVAY
ncbi:NAD(P)-dependent oxidoreductase [Paenibacillus sp. CMAA1364]